jgi:hypothetical protein
VTCAGEMRGISLASTLSYCHAYSASRRGERRHRRRFPHARYLFSKPRYSVLMSSHHSRSRCARNSPSDVSKRSSRQIRPASIPIATTKTPTKDGTSSSACSAVSRTSGELLLAKTSAPTSISPPSSWRQLLLGGSIERTLEQRGEYDSVGPRRIWERVEDGNQGLEAVVRRSDTAAARSPARHAQRRRDLNHQVAQSRTASAGMADSDAGATLSG